ncbi:MAG: transcription termination factor Rho [Clostridiales bacterium]|nr:transcription termination factor Rho [Clostridiales bacterium]
MEQAEAMSQQQLADLLNREQKMSEAIEKTAEPPKAEKAAKTTKKTTSKKTTAKAEKEEAPKKEEKPKAEKPAKAAKKTTSKKSEKKPEAEALPMEELIEKKNEEASVKEEVSAEPAKKEEKASKSKSRSKKKADEPKEKEEAPVASEAEAAEKTESAKDEKKDEKAASKSRSKKAKKDAKEEVKEEKKQDEQKEEKQEEKKEEVKPEETSSDVKKEEPKAENRPANSDKQQSKNNKKSRHRSVEIRPAGETAPSAESASSENGEQAEGEARPEQNNKPQIEPTEFIGVLEIVQEGGYGFVRRENYLPSPQDIFVPNNIIRRFGLRMGDQIQGFALPKKNQDKNLALSYITTVNGVELDKLGKRPHFERLTPIYPDERFRLETGKQELSTRIIDLVSPIGKGQRGMIVSPPKAGKTILLQKIANAISQNSPKTKLIVLLIDERPEEVTDMQRSIKGEVVYSTFDKKPENHTRVTELVLERAMRLVEMGEDVVILLDSMTRLARAYNLTITPTGRTLSGGLDPGSLYGPKRFFGAARNIENGGSLTIVATSLIETGSRMDEVIFEEFKGTGNMEVYLDRKLSEKRIFPAIDINKSGTRREDLLMSQEELDAVWTIRKAFSQMETAPVTETIINLLLRTNSNDHFIRSVKVSFADKEVFDAMRGTGSNGNNTNN